MQVTARRLQISARNSAFQVFDSLRTNRQKRQALRQFLVEGVVPVDRALGHGWRVESILVPAATSRSRWAADAIARSSPDRIYEIAPPLFAELSGKDEPSELILVVHRPDDDLGRIPVGPDLLVVVCDRPSSPGNLGTIIRSCDSLGAHGLVSTGHGVDLYAPSTITASRGSLFALPSIQQRSPADVADWISGVRAGRPECQVVGTDEEGTIVVEDCDLTRPTVLVCGNETSGMSRAFRELCDLTVRIPIGGSASSLNVAVAAGIVLYERSRQRRRGNVRQNSE